MGHPTTSAEDVARLRAVQSGTPLAPYEELLSADRWNSRRRGEARAIVSGEWEWKGRPGVEISVPVDWDGLCGSDRSWAVALHGWEPLASVLTVFARTGEAAYLDFAVAVATDWLRSHAAISAESPYPWYDAAVGMRAYRLAYILDAACRERRFTDDVIQDLLAGLFLHDESLRDDATFARHSNHGLYQVMGQLAIGRRFAPQFPALEETRAQGLARFRELMDAHFTPEAVHREHSPEYQRLMLISLQGLITSGLVSETWAQELYARVEENLAWFVMPSGRLAMFGDTSGGDVTRANVSDVGDPALRFALSRGSEGAPPAETIKAFPQSGYVVVRDRWPEGAEDFSDCSYLAQTCAFHSRTHKHADDLSFVWYDRGQDILTDAGRFGYVGRTDPSSELARQGFWYSDPRRIYVESTRAHNTVEIDGRSHPRRGVEPYGSGLVQWGEQHGIAFSECAVAHGDVEHRRLLFYRPRDWLIVADHVADPTGQPHEFTQRFHFAPDLDVLSSARGARANLRGDDVLFVASMSEHGAGPELARGREGDLLGFMSVRDGALVPQWTAAYSADGRPAHTFVTLLAFDEPEPAPLPASPAAGLESLELAWRHGDVEHSLSASRDGEGRLQLGYTPRPGA